MINGNPRRTGTRPPLPLADRDLAQERAPVGCIPQLLVMLGTTGLLAIGIAMEKLWS